MRIRTSETDPIRLDVLPAGLVPTPGRLGLTFAPGKNVGGLDGTWRRDLRADLLRLRDVYGVAHILALIEDHELVSLGIARYADEVDALGGLVLQRFPIPDGGVPADLATLRLVVAGIVTSLRAGVHVAVHCRGGLGRAGTVASCCLVELGHAPDVAVREVRIARPGAVENRGQEQAVHAYARRVR